MSIKDGGMPQVHAPQSFSDRDFRNVLGLFATGVVVITSVGNAIRRDGNCDGRLGVTISSFSSVSLDPPLILFSIARRSNAFVAWQSIEHFAVNILAEKHSAISARFARATTDKWDGINTCRGLGGAPLLSDALAWIDCRTHAKHDGGDHLIVVGHVLSLSARPGADGRPLIVFQGQYRQLDVTPKVATQPDAEQWLHGW